MRTITTCAVALAGMLLPGTALAQDMRSDWYVAAAGTISMLEDSNTTVLALPIPPGYSDNINKFDTGWGGQFAVGYRLERARIEIEGGYTKDGSDRYIAIVPATGEIAAKGGHRTMRIMANAYYELLDGPVQPYVGAGVGYARIKVKHTAARAFFPTEEPRRLLDDKSGELAFQAMAGAAFRVSDTMALTTQYRWLTAGKVHLTDLGGFEHVREHSGHNVDLGVRIML